MTHIAKKFARSKLVLIMGVLSLLFVLGGWGWAHGALRTITEPLILHFNNLKGINQVGTVADLAEIGILGVLMVAINFMVALELENRDQFLGKFVIALTLFMGILIFIGFAAIINVN